MHHCSNPHPIEVFNTRLPPIRGGREGKKPGSSHHESNQCQNKQENVSWPTSFEVIAQRPKLMHFYFCCSCIKGSLLPPVATTGWIFRTSAIACPEGGSFSKLSFGESFALAVPKANLTTKTLLLTIWSVITREGDRDDDEECLGSSQVTNVSSISKEISNLANE